MKKDNFSFTRGFFLGISLLIVTIGVFIPESNLKISILGALVIIALVIFDIKAPEIAKLSKDNPKVKTIRNISRLIIFIFAIVSLYFVISPIRSSFSQKTNELIVIGLISLFMMIFGNVSPKIPFNRYLGLRLPWTIRDEETWKIAHRILGYLSFPIAILQFILVFFFSTKIVAVICMISWVSIPGIYSLWFYYRKYKVSRIS